MRRWLIISLPLLFAASAALAQSSSVSVNGIGFQSSPSTNTVPVVTAGDSASYESIPNCQDSSGNHLNFNTTNHTFACGTTVGDVGTASGTLPIGHGGTGQTTSPTDGQLLIGDSSTGGFDLATLTAGANVTITNSHGGITIAASGSGGSGCMTSGATGDVLTDNGSGGCTSNTKLTFSSGTLTIGSAGSTLGVAALAGSTSGTISIEPQAAAGTYNFNLPTSAGTSGQFLTSGGGSSSPMTWTGLASGDLFVGNGSSIPAAVALSGDCTLANTGAITCTQTNGTAFGTAATANTGTSGGTLPYLNGTNTWSGPQTFGEVLGTVTQQTGATYTFAATDCGTTVEFTSSSAVAATLPNSLPIGCHIAAVQAGTGQITFSPASGATMYSAHSFTMTYGQYAVVGVSVIENSGGSAAVWYLTGDGA